MKNCSGDRNVLKLLEEGEDPARIEQQYAADLEQFRQRAFRVFALLNLKIGEKRKRAAKGALPFFSLGYGRFLVLRFVLASRRTATAFRRRRGR